MAVIAEGDQVQTNVYMINTDCQKRMKWSQMQMCLGREKCQNIHPDVTSLTKPTFNCGISSWGPGVAELHGWAASWQRSISDKDKHPEQKKSKVHTWWAHPYASSIQNTGNPPRGNPTQRMTGSSLCLNESRTFEISTIKGASGGVFHL